MSGSNQGIVGGHDLAGGQHEITHVGGDHEAIHCAAKVDSFRAYMTDERFLTCKKKLLWSRSARTRPTMHKTRLIGFLFNMGNVIRIMSCLMVPGSARAHRRSHSVK